MYRDKIWQKDPYYKLLKPIVGLTTKSGYRKVEVHGYENIPKDGAVIIAPNHCNTLMDALVILRAFKDETVFGARADIFNKPAIAKIMYFLRILPQIRQRDGLRNVLKNNDTQEIIVETLENKVRFCIFPEGKHRPAHSLQPLGKGVFRAALAANAKFGDKFPVYIVPAGIEYGDYFRYRSTSVVNFGKPINVTEFVMNNPVENEVQLIEPLRMELASRMSGLFTFLKDDEQLADKWTLTKILAIDKGIRYGNYGTKLYDDMLADRKIAAGIEKKCDEHPGEMAELLEKVEAFEKKRRKKGISIYSFRKKNEVLNVVLRSLIAVLGFPYWICCATLSAPMWLTFNKIRKNTKDRAFHNTVGFGTRLAFSVLLGLIYIVLAFCLLPWKAVLPILVVILPTYMSYFFDYNEAMRRFFSDIRLMGEKKLRGFYSDIVKAYNKL